MNKERENNGRYNEYGMTVSVREDERVTVAEGA